MQTCVVGRQREGAVKTGVRRGEVAAGGLRGGQQPVGLRIARRSRCAAGRQGQSLGHTPVAQGCDYVIKHVAMSVRVEPVGSIRQF